MERKGEEGGKNVGERVEEISGRAEGEEAESSGEKRKAPYQREIWRNLPLI